MLPLPPRSTLFPYTTLFRSEVRVLELSRPLRRIIRRAGRDWDEEPQALKPRTIPEGLAEDRPGSGLDRKSTRLNSSHTVISYAVFCLKKKKPGVTHRGRVSKSYTTTIRGRH